MHVIAQSHKFECFGTYYMCYVVCIGNKKKVVASYFCVEDEWWWWMNNTYFTMKYLCIYTLKIVSLEAMHTENQESKVFVDSLKKT